MRSFSIACPLALGLACLTGLSEAFATPENLAKLAQRDGLSLGDLLTELTTLREKTVALDPITDPIQGEQAME